MDQNSETLETQERASVGRRTLLKGAAWSVPAVLVVGTTPALAVSLQFTFNLSPTLVNVANAGATVVASGNGTTRQNVTISVVGITTGAKTPITVQVDVDGNWTYPFPTLVDDVYTITAESQATPIQRSLTKDTVAPTVSNTKLSRNGNSVNVNFEGTKTNATTSTTDSLVSVSVTPAGPTFGLITQTAAGTSWAVTASGLTKGTAYTFTATQTDGATNSSSVAGTITIPV